MVYFFQILEKAGFINVKAEDKTDLFLEILAKELKRLESIKDEFLKVSNAALSKH